MDAVITYVDGLDPLWQEDYRKAVGQPVLEKRFRDWGTLKYLLRGIETFMPFISNVYLIVARESQVPQWVDRSRLKIVLHSDIIPSEYLPVFNSTAIEMFIHRIPGLDEQYIYFNDDMFPVMPCSAEDFFPGGKAAIGFSKHFFSRSMYKKHVRYSDALARKAAGVGKGFCFLRPQHICSPMLKSDCEQLFKIANKEILDSVTALREECNYNQYIFLNYSYYLGHSISRRLSKKHISLALYSGERVAEFLKSPYRKLVCINDVQDLAAPFIPTRDAMLKAFDGLLPDKSKYEL